MVFPWVPVTKGEIYSDPGTPRKDAASGSNPRFPPFSFLELVLVPRPGGVPRARGQDCLPPGLSDAVGVQALENTASEREAQEVTMSSRTGAVVRPRRSPTVDPFFCPLVDPVGDLSLGVSDRPWAFRISSIPSPTSGGCQGHSDL